MTETLFLSSDELVDLAEPRDYVEAVREAYRERGQGAPAEPRTSLTRREPWGMLTGYTAILPASSAMGGYMYSAGFQAADAWFILPLFDARTGEPLALLDGAAINPLKTGAAGAVAIDALARDNASTLAVFGSGRQAWGQVLCAAAVRELDAVRVHSPTAEHRRAFAKTMQDQLGIPVDAVEHPRDALEGADIVITATRSSGPVFDGLDLPEGVHVTAMGQYHPRRREVDTRTVAQAIYVPDLTERAFHDSGELLLAIEDGAIDESHVHAELGEIVAGSKPGRANSEQTTLFDSGGTGIETVAAARMLYERAKAQDLGQRIELSSASEAMPRAW